MKFKLLLSGSILLSVLLASAYKHKGDNQAYKELYKFQFESFSKALNEYYSLLENEHPSPVQIKQGINDLRMKMKSLDFWWRYANPLAYKSINGPLPVEWETEVFEKYEPPYRRVGAGLTLALQQLDEDSSDIKAVMNLIQPMKTAIRHFEPDSMNELFNKPEHFYFCNRLFLLNAASIYTTGFECPDTSSVLPELKAMVKSVRNITMAYNVSFPDHSCDNEYTSALDALIDHLEAESECISLFGHYQCVRGFINPLYALNAKIILKRGYRSGNLTDYSLNNKALSIFDKQLYTAQNDKGIFGRVTDPATIAEIDQLGKLLFYDPILSGNNQRSCASCHIPNQYYADTLSRTALKFNKMGRLSRNTPSTINAGFNHLIMADGKHLTLQEQAVAVMCNMDEMGSVKGEILDKVMSCKVYAEALTRLAKLTPQSPKPGIDHIVSAITLHYGKFSLYDSPLDRAMNKKEELNPEVVLGYNLFMSKAQCATCHFVPQFNGVKPPYVGSEFEVLGVPEDTSFIKLSSDSGRYYINPAFETFRAFRTGTIRNASKTAPYMHNGVFRTLTEVVQFYNNGGAQGRGLQLENQTLSGDKLGLTEFEIRCLVLFMESLTEDIVFEPAPEQLPKSKKKTLSNRTVGGNY